MSLFFLQEKKCSTTSNLQLCFLHVLLCFLSTWLTSVWDIPDRNQRCRDGEDGWRRRLRRRRLRHCDQSPSSYHGLIQYWNSWRHQIPAVADSCYFYFQGYGVCNKSRLFCNISYVPRMSQTNSSFNKRRNFLSIRSGLKSTLRFCH